MHFRLQAVRRRGCARGMLSLILSPSCGPILCTLRCRRTFRSRAVSRRGRLSAHRCWRTRCRRVAVGSRCVMKTRMLGCRVAWNVVCPPRARTLNHFRVWLLSYLVSIGKRFVPRSKRGILTPLLATPSQGRNCQSSSLPPPPPPAGQLPLRGSLRRYRFSCAVSSFVDLLCWYQHAQEVSPMVT